MMGVTFAQDGCAGGNRMREAPRGSRTTPQGEALENS